MHSYMPLSTIHLCNEFSFDLNNSVLYFAAADKNTSRFSNDYVQYFCRKNDTDYKLVWIIVRNHKPPFPVTMRGRL